MTVRRVRIALALTFVAVLVVGGTVTYTAKQTTDRTTVVGYFANSNGIFVGDEVRILGVPVGKIDRIEPLPGRARITFWVNKKYKVPASVNAVIISPTLISARAIQLTPAYNTGPTLASGAVLQQDHTAVPVEWDDFRAQLEKLTQALQPTTPGGVAPLGQLINTAADNLRGNGAAVRQTVIELSQAMSALGDHSTDIFSTVRNLAALVTALHGSSQILSELNENLAAVTGLLADSPNEIGNAISGLNQAAVDLNAFLTDNREALRTTIDKTTSISSAVNESIYDVKQILHVAPTLMANFINIYQPAQGAITGALAFNNFANPIDFICGAIQAASRLGAEQSAKLCVQYLAPIVKNRQYNYLPIGSNFFVGAMARPNEITYSEDRLRPDYDPRQPVSAPQGQPLPAEAQPPAADNPPPPPQPTQADPTSGLQGLLIPPAGTP